MSSVATEECRKAGRILPQYKPIVKKLKDKWGVKPKTAAYWLLFDTFKEAADFAARPDFLDNYGGRLMT